MSGPRSRSFKAVTRTLHSDVTDIGLCRDLAVPFKAPKAMIPIEVRPLEPDDNVAFLNSGADSPVEAITKFGEGRFLKLNLPTCYLAVAPDGEVCYLQWLIAATENDKLRMHFGDLFPRIGSDEALLEAAYTVPAYRGKGIMACAMAQIAERALAFGARRVITFVETGNIPSLKGCERAGFFPYAKRTRSWRWLNRKTSFSLMDSPLRGSSTNAA